MTPKRLAGFAATALLFVAPALSAAPLDVPPAPASLLAAGGSLGGLTADRMGATVRPRPADAAAAQPKADVAPAWVDTVMARSMALLGTPYRWGGSSPEQGFDCSGLVRYVLGDSLAAELPRRSRDMARMRGAERIGDRSELAVGDLVFFGRSGRVDHVGIYVGDGRFVHAPSRGKAVRISSMGEAYWRKRYVEALRVKPARG
ncbi:C40 family peptidase [Coralloluteibacterium stylophorae]|uniref:C40 family peptidase n=1 Tax=Coralloluteibacterium stylophorae TaxID=1776034 RepID=A0AAP2CCP6_9GAMM|nr:C40 family peptidase [Coralloluteibacterium stylophorae]MBS7457540.1 C40 family peptidase [Coralloluteibacterium stylophorae]